MSYKADNAGKRMSIDILDSERGDEPRKMPQSTKHHGENRGLEQGFSSIKGGRRPSELSDHSIQGRMQVVHGNLMDNQAKEGARNRGSS